MHRYHGYTKLDPMAPVKQHVAQDETRGLQWLRLVATRATDASVRKQAIAEISKIEPDWHRQKVDPSWHRSL